MAWDFGAEIHALTGFDADSTDATVTAETYQVHATQWLTDSAKEVINVLPQGLLNLCASQQTFTSGTANTLNTGKILTVFRNDGEVDQPCREISPEQKGRYSDPSDMNSATITDPVYFIENNTIDVLPTGGSCKYSEVQYPAVAYSGTAIAVFPDEAERAVILGASIKAAEYMFAHDQDIELTGPIITGLKGDYQKALEGIATGRPSMPQQQQGGAR